MSKLSTQYGLGSSAPSSWRECWLWLNLLSLDAVIVAIVWQLFFAESLNVVISPAAVASLALTVWLIYTADRLLDVLPLNVLRTKTPLSTRRHRFHCEHKRLLASAMAIAIFALVVITQSLRPVLFRSGLAIAGVVALYFAIAHFAPPLAQRLCPKQVAVGIVFAAGTFLAPLTRLADRLTRGFSNGGALIAPAVLFALLCCLNCVAIEEWEWIGSGAPLPSRPHRLTEWLARKVRFFAAFIALTAALLFFTSASHLLLTAIALSSLAFVWLDKEKHRFSADGLRVLADVPLLSPLLVLSLR